MTQWHSTLRVWAAPVALALLTSLGLLAALFGDGLWNAVSWVALGIPVAVSAWALGKACIGRLER